MRIITLVTQKGGTGKTTLAASLAVAAHEAGEKVLALDLDPQGSLATWGDIRDADAPHIEPIPAAKVADLATLISSVEGQGFTLTRGRNKICVKSYAKAERSVNSHLGPA